jgi:hypothetical protein
MKTEIIAMILCYAAGLLAVSLILDGISNGV